MKDKLFNELVESIKEAGKITRSQKKPGRVFRRGIIDIKAIRQNIGLTQEKFAMMVGVSPRTLQNWEQGHRKPEGPALALLTIFNNDPKHAFVYNKPYL